MVHIGPQCMMAGKRMEKEGHNSAQFLNQPGAFHGRLGHGAMIAHGYARSRLLWHLHLQIFCSEVDTTWDVSKQISIVKLIQLIQIVFNR